MKFLLVLIKKMWYNKIKEQRKVFCMKEYTFLDSPIKVFGIPHFEARKTLRRLPDELIEKIPSLNFLGRRPMGARLGFKTDSKKFTVKIELETLGVDIGMSIYSCQSAYVFVGQRQSSRFLGIVNPYSYEQKVLEKTFYKSGEMEDVLVYLPRNEIIKNVWIYIEDEAKIEAPTPYKYSKPMLFYGSSITEGGIACNVCNGYNAVISRHLDADYYNLGFSGNAKGEIEMADFINTIDMSVFIYDYDHNAPTPEHLEKTHEPFFKRIREMHPTLPVVMMSRPYAVYGDEEKRRREIVKKTYENARKNGDTNVYFIDGEEPFRNYSDRELCFIDTIHPNDLGYSLMVAHIEPLIKEILEAQK